MKADRRAPRWQPLTLTTPAPITDAAFAAHVAHAREIDPDIDENRIRELRAEIDDWQMWQNDRYVVHLIRWPNAGPQIPGTIAGCDVVQLSIRRQDRGAARDWRDFQRIKNQLVGPECEAVELYPAESRLLDAANQFHLWVIDSPTYRWPVGFNGGRSVSDKSVAGSVQRPFDEEVQP